MVSCNVAGRSDMGHSSSMGWGEHRMMMCAGYTASTPFPFFLIGNGYLLKRLNLSVSTWSTTRQRSPRVDREANVLSSRPTSGPGSTRGGSPVVVAPQIPPPVQVVIVTVTLVRLRSPHHDIHHTASTVTPLYCVCICTQYLHVSALLYYTLCYYSTTLCL